MSTLNITPAFDTELDAAFDRVVVTAFRARSAGEGDPVGPAFEAAFDLDYNAVPAGSCDDLDDTPRLVPQPVTVAGPARPALRLTRRGRLLVSLAFLGASLALMTAMGGWAVASLGGGEPAPVRVVEVQPGQTLYDIAGETAEPGHVREMVYRIQELNSLPSGRIAEGQKLAIPQG